MFRICNNSFCMPAGTWVPVPRLCSACSESAAPPHVGATSATSGGYQSEKRHQRKLRHHRYILFLRTLHANFPGAFSASNSVSVENVHLQNGVTVSPFGRAAMGTRSSSSSTKSASGAWTREAALSRSASWKPLHGLGGQHPFLAARSLLPSLACICCG